MVGQGLTVPLRHSGVTVGSVQGSDHLCPALVQPETLWRRHPPFLRLPGSFRLEGLYRRDPCRLLWCHLCVHDCCQNTCIFMAGRVDPALVLLCWGGCCFSKATSYVCPLVLFLSCPSPPRCSALSFPPILPPLNFWKAHLEYSCFLWDGPYVSSHALCIRGFFFFFLLSCSHKVVSAL